MDRGVFLMLSDNVSNISINDKEVKSIISSDGGVIYNKNDDVSYDLIFPKIYEQFSFSEYPSTPVPLEQRIVSVIVGKTYYIKFSDDDMISFTPVMQSEKGHYAAYAQPLRVQWISD